MYGQQTLQNITFLILYGGVAVLALMAALYLLLRRANAFEPSVNPPRVLRRWTAAFMFAAMASHVWWFVLGVYWMTDDRLVRNITAILLDHATLVPLVMGVLLAMLQDRRRPFWPWLLAQISVIAAGIMGIVWHDEFWGYKVSHYAELVVITIFVVYYLFQLRQYGRWLRDNYADLEHKEVWQSLVFAVGLFMVYEIYTSNSGETLREYLAQILSIAIFAFFVWRVETLQRLEADVAEIAPQREDYNYIGALLAERCAATGLYLQPDLSLTQLSLTLGVNRTYLSAYFAQSGTTYNAYVNGLRVEYFERLYAKNVGLGRPVTARQLSVESGFRNYNTFATAFKRMRGVTVAEWMKRGESGSEMESKSESGSKKGSKRK